MEALLDKLADLRAGGFVDDAPLDLGRYGLSPPAGTITVWTQDPQPQKLSVGAVIQGSTNRYGRVEGRPSVVQLPDTITELLSTTVDPLRPPPAPPTTPSQSPSSLPVTPKSK